MELAYEASDPNAPLRQAELLAHVLEPRPLTSGRVTDGAVEFEAVPHPYAVVVSQDCDLEQDHGRRFPAEGQLPTAEELDADPVCMSHVLFCDAHAIDDLKAFLPSNFGRDDRKRIVQNQNERYHYLPPAPVDHAPDPLPQFLIDFRKPFTTPTGLVYVELSEHSAAGIGEDESATKRLGILPAFYLHQLIQRFFSYQARVAIL